MHTTINLLNTITALSHEFGTTQYVKAGGGNTSCKDADTLWVKPAGTTLASLQPQIFIAMRRNALSGLYQATPPAAANAREELVKNMMANAVVPQTPGRASVEAPLHDSLAARYVVHTHPALVNGLTCSIGGAEAAARLFPDALWIPYTDPGYTLCMVVRKAVTAYKDAHGREPTLIFWENHGIFVAADSAEEIRAAYARVMQTLTAEYSAAGVGMDIAINTLPQESQVAKWHTALVAGLGDDSAAIEVSGRFTVGAGAISPDHIVYAKSYPFDGVLTVANLRAFRAVRGYAPRVIVTDTAVLGVGANKKSAALALELALDGALVKQLARAFGGIRYLSDVARGFIENWEVESYRARQI